jgi:hypothetical protein
MDELIIPPGYTVEVYKKDRRTKSGERLDFKSDYTTEDLSMLEHTVRHTWPASQGYRIEIHKTFVECVTIFGHPFVERYDTPYTCSPASETYWSS